MPHPARWLYASGPGAPRSSPLVRLAQALLCSALLSAGLVAQDAPPRFHSESFNATPVGQIPAGWRDLGVVRSSPNWGTDGRGSLRTIWKGERGLIACENGPADGAFADGTVIAHFRKTPEPEVSVAVAGRIRDANNYYAVRFWGTNDIALIKVADGQEETLAQFVTRERYVENQRWALSLALRGSRLTGRILNQDGVEQARVDALDERGFALGRAGLQCTNYAAVEDFSIEAAAPTASATQAVAKKPDAPSHPGTVLTAAKDIEAINTPFTSLAGGYDIVVAGAGTGGWAAAIQASRQGAKVLLVEESDWIGGQMAAAAVTSMDEEGVWGKFPVRERGLYREFHQSVINHYYTLNKDPFRAYYAWPEQLEGGYEPKVARAILYAFIAEARKTGTLDLVTGTQLTAVHRKGDVVTGVALERDNVKRSVDCRVLIDATEYGDVLPLAGARYRVGASTSDNLDLDSPLQFHTWLGVIREYPGGLPEHLRIKSPPPGYNPKRYAKSQLYGRLIWGGPGKDYKGPRVYRVLLAWRGMADEDSPMTGLASQQRHTQCGLNGGRQDYPVTVAGIEDPAVRREQQREGIYRTLNEIYYLQNELGLPWSVAEDEGYRTPYQERTMAKLELRPDLLPIALSLPQWPYVRESRRGRGLYTMRTSDMGRFEEARLFPNSLAMGDYFMDIDHGKTATAIETDLDKEEKPARTGGPFQVPFEALVAEKIDGLVFAEKNFSQSRIVNGATRLQPSTMLIGQAAGAIAAQAVREGVYPREVNPLHVQIALLRAGSNLIQRWYEDVAWGSDLWQATQLLSLHGVMDAPGPFARTENTSMGTGNFWQPSATLSAKDLAAALQRLAELAGHPATSSEADAAPTWAVVDRAFASIDPAWRADAQRPALAPDQTVRREDFALAAAQILGRTGKPVLLRDPVE
jgi:hypothetical protein